MTTAIVYQAMLRLLIKDIDEKWPEGMTVPARIRRNRKNFHLIGLANEKGVLDYADTWPTVISFARYTTTTDRTVGSHIIDAMPYMEERVRRVVAGGFSKIIGCSVDEYEHNEIDDDEPSIWTSMLLFVCNFSLLFESARLWYNCMHVFEVCGRKKIAATKQNCRLK